MKKKYIFILSFFLSVASFAQNNITIKGKILDKNSQEYISVNQQLKVLLSKIKDLKVWKVDYSGKMQDTILSIGVCKGKTSVLKIKSELVHAKFKLR